jgi:hypothetical protein
MMHEPEKSDPGIVAMKPANKTEQSVAEPVERRAGTKGNADQQSTCRTQSRISVSQALERIRKVQNALPSHTRGGSRMRESRTYGSVRGALSNERPYRVPTDDVAVWPCVTSAVRVRRCIAVREMEEGPSRSAIRC